MVAHFSDEITENRLGWYNHVRRRDDYHVVIITLNITEQKMMTWWPNIKRDVKAQVTEETTLDIIVYYLIRWTSRDSATNT